MSSGGKGSSPRPFSVTQQEYDARWDAIFRRYIKDDKQKFDEQVIMKAEYYDVDIDPENPDGVL